jgi:hypothetical protein
VLRVNSEKGHEGDKRGVGWEAGRAGHLCLVRKQQNRVKGWQVRKLGKAQQSRAKRTHLVVVKCQTEFAFI